mmetsp:Transcript_19378/g.44957  ORF Transcript_19378/g.44957 Transcript_19378/m.44957 type:complete len:264 (+) Transcript_19378:161-952(+)
MRCSAGWNKRWRWSFHRSFPIASFIQFHFIPSFVCLALRRRRRRLPFPYKKRDATAPWSYRAAGRDRASSCTLPGHTRGPAPFGSPTFRPFLGALASGAGPYWSRSVPCRCRCFRRFSRPCSCCPCPCSCPSSTGGGPSQSPPSSRSSRPWPVPAAACRLCTHRTRVPRCEWPTNCPGLPEERVPPGHCRGAHGPCRARTLPPCSSQRARRARRPRNSSSCAGPDASRSSSGQTALSPGGTGSVCGFPVRFPRPCSLPCRGTP